MKCVVIATIQRRRHEYRLWCFNGTVCYNREDADLFISRFLNLAVEHAECLSGERGLTVISAKAQLPPDLVGAFMPDVKWAIVKTDIHG